MSADRWCPKFADAKKAQTAMNQIKTREARGTKTTPAFAISIEKININTTPQESLLA